eukprot:6478162-Prymnesium_polylepis.2
MLGLADHACLHHSRHGPCYMHLHNHVSSLQPSCAETPLNAGDASRMVATQGSVLAPAPVGPGARCGRPGPEP